MPDVNKANADKNFRVRKLMKQKKEGFQIPDFFN